MHHPSHPGHWLTYVWYPLGFICDGCGEGVQGNGYRCAACNFDLHECCATAPPVLDQSFHGGNGNWVQLQTLPPCGSQMQCSECAHRVSGLGYYCRSSSCGYALHPTCALLPRRHTQVEIAPKAHAEVGTVPLQPDLKFDDRDDHHHSGRGMALRGGKFLGKLAFGVITGDPTSIGGALADLVLSD
ncbi:hypothetical protein SUGI_1006910 [Cryptomeria japonica]|nr:hypothetical protein SUGI_1006910 [Cryptomeria japonica]